MDQTLTASFQPFAFEFRDDVPKVNPSEVFEAKQARVLGLGGSPCFDQRPVGGITFFTDVNAGTLYAARGTACTPYDINQGPTEVVGLTSSGKVIVTRGKELGTFDIDDSSSFKSFVADVDKANTENWRIGSGKVLNINGEDILIAGGVSLDNPRQANAGLYAIRPSGEVGILKRGMYHSAGLDTFRGQLLQNDLDAGQMAVFDVKPDFRLIQKGSFNFTQLDSKLCKLDQDKDAGKTPQPYGLAVNAEESLLLVSLYRAGVVVGVDGSGIHAFTLEVNAPFVTGCEIIGKNRVMVTTQQGGPREFEHAGSVCIFDTPEGFDITPKEPRYLDI